MLRNVDGRPRVADTFGLGDDVPTAIVSDTVHPEPEQHIASFLQRKLKVPKALQVRTGNPDSHFRKVCICTEDMRSLQRLAAAGVDCRHDTVPKTSTYSMNNCGAAVHPSAAEAQQSHGLTTASLHNLCHASL